MKLKLLTFIIFSAISITNFAQDSIVKPANKQTIFANIFTGAYYNFNTIKPNAGFELSTALLGYKFENSKNISFTLIYDVTRTTNGINVYDSSDTKLSVLYFEGSKYTAFLKMAEIKWKFAKNFSLSAGELLNEQYLTVQDKYWAHRYVMVTMQELYKMANPADFGMRIEYRNPQKLAFSVGANNGNGPFRYQDAESVIEYTSNLEIFYVKNLLIKTFIALTPATIEAENNLKTAFSGFISYKINKYNIGFEYSNTKNPEFINKIYSGTSAFILYQLTPKYELFGRYDYVDNSPVASYENIFVGGIQFTPESNLFLSVNYRYWEKSEIQQLYFNLGAKF